MKKTITLFALACMGYVPASQAQTFLLEDFESTVGNALPTGWTQTNVGTITWNSGTNTTLQSTNFAVEAHTRMVGINDDAAGNTSVNSDQFLKSPVIDLSTSTAPALQLDMFWFAAIYNGAQESMKIEISTNGGTSWTPLVTVTGNNLTPWQTRSFPLTGCAGQANVKIGFRYSDGGGWLFGGMLDNIKVYQLPPNEIAITPLSFGNMGIAATGTPVTANFTNLGVATITSATIQYQLDGGAAVSQSFTGLNVATFASSSVTFTTPVTGFSMTGTHTVKVTAMTVNGAPDGNAANDTASVIFTPATQAVTHNGLIEEFSSSTCGPCAGFNQTFDPLVTTTNHANQPNSHFNVVKYQMNWPSPNTDRSYNAHGNTRKTYYAVTGIPDHFTNGLQGGSGTQAEIDASKAGDAFMLITGSYVINNNNTVNASYSVTPYFNKAGNFKVFAAAVQRQYHLQDVTTTVGQYDFVYAMRRMFPDGGGTPVTTLVAGTPLTNTWTSQAVTVNPVPAQGSFDFWSSPFNSDLVIFVQNVATKEIYQSQAIPAAWPTSIPNIANDTKVIVFPNPAKDRAVIALNMENPATVKIAITDIVGHVVYTSTEAMTSGRHDVILNTADYASGTYNVTVQTEKGMLTEHLSVVK